MKEPQVHPSVYVAPTSTLIGDVSIAEEASIWFGCVVRADKAPITIGPRTNVQDLTVLHVDREWPCHLGAAVSVGHRAVIHGATVKDGAMIGIGAIVLNGAVVEEKALVGAGALVPPGMVVPARSLAVGIPAKIVRPLEEDDLAWLEQNIARYVELARTYRQEVKGDKDGKSSRATETK